MSNLRLDEIDLRIIYLLRKDSRISISDIARILGISRPTVYSRIRRLEDSGVIKGYTIKLDKEIEYGPNLVALLIKTNDIKKVTESIRAIEIFRLAGGKYLVVANIESISDLKSIEESDNVELLEISPIIEVIEGERALPIKVKFKCDYCGKDIIEDPHVYYLGSKVYFFCCKTCLREFKKLAKRGNV